MHFINKYFLNLRTNILVLSKYYTFMNTNGIFLNKYFCFGLIFYFMNIATFHMPYVTDICKRFASPHFKYLYLEISCTCICFYGKIFHSYVYFKKIKRSLRWNKLKQIIIETFGCYKSHGLVWYICICVAGP